MLKINIGGGHAASIRRRPHLRRISTGTREGLAGASQPFAGTARIPVSGRIEGRLTGNYAEDCGEATETDRKRPPDISDRTAAPDAAASAVGCDRKGVPELQNGEEYRNCRTGRGREGPNDSGASVRKGRLYVDLAYRHPASREPPPARQLRPDEQSPPPAKADRGDFQSQRHGGKLRRLSGSEDSGNFTGVSLRSRPVGRAASFACGSGSIPCRLPFSARGENGHSRQKTSPAISSLRAPCRSFRRAAPRP